MILDDAQIRDVLRVYAIGDVHGCINELRQMIENIDAGSLFSHLSNVK